MLRDSQWVTCMQTQAHTNERAPEWKHCERKERWFVLKLNCEFKRIERMRASVSWRRKKPPCVCELNIKGGLSLVGWLRWQVGSSSTCVLRICLERRNACFSSSTFYLCLIKKLAGPHWKIHFAMPKSWNATHPPLQYIKRKWRKKFNSEKLEFVHVCMLQKPLSALCILALTENKEKKETWMHTETFLHLSSRRIFVKHG